MQAGTLEHRRESRGRSFRWLVRIPTTEVEREQPHHPQAAEAESHPHEAPSTLTSPAHESFDEVANTAAAARVLRDHIVTLTVSVALLILALVLYLLPLAAWVNGIAIPLAVIAGAVSLSELVRIPAARRNARGDKPHS